MCVCVCGFFRWVSYDWNLFVFLMMYMGSDGSIVCDIV